VLSACLSMWTGLQVHVSQTALLFEHIAVPACHLLSVQIKGWGLIYSPVECMAELVHTTAS